MLDRFIRTLAGRSYTTILVLGILVGLSALSISHIKVNRDSDFYTLENSSVIEFHEQFKKDFNDDEFFLVLVEAEDIFTKPVLSRIRSLTSDLEALQNVREVTSITNVDDIVGSESDFSVARLIPKHINESVDLRRIKQRALENPVYQNTIISTDAKTAAIVIFPDVSEGPEGFRTALIEEVRRLTSKHATEAVTFRLAGWTLINAYLSEYSMRDNILFLPLISVLILVTTFIFIRDFQLTFFAAVHIVISQILSASVMVWSGVWFNSITGIVFPILLFLSLSDCVHVFSYFKEQLESEHSRLTLVLKVCRSTMPACFFTSVTTAIGFGSLIVSEVPPIRDFGLVASQCVILEFLISFLLLPPLLYLYRAKEKAPPPLTFSLMRSVRKFVDAYSGLVVTIGIALTIFGALSITKLEVNTNLLEYFREGSQIRIDTTVAEQRLAGTATMDLSLRIPGFDGFKDPDHLEVLDKVQAHVSGLNEVEYTLSFANLIKDMHESFHNEDSNFYRVPDSRALIEQYLLLYDGDVLEDVMNPDFNHARVTIRTSLHDTRNLRGLITQIEEICESTVPPQFTCTVTGTEKRYVEVADALVDGQVQSILLAYLIVLLVLVVAFRSVGLALFSLVPNVLPLFGNFAVMALLDIPLNTGTAMISSVAFGIAVDDTIHLLLSYKELRHEGADPLVALNRTLDLKGSGVLSSSLIFCLGFSVLGLASFVPVVQFGILCAVTMLIALFADILFLPALFLHFYRK